MVRRHFCAGTGECGFGCWGPLLVDDGASWSAIRAAQQRLVAAVLLIEAGRAVPADRLVDELWGERPPPSAAATVRGYVMRLRRLLGGGPGSPLVTRGRDYELVVAGGDVDARVFSGLATSARHALADGQPAAAAAKLSQGLALWRGPALADLPASPAVTAEAERLGQLRLAAVEDWLGVQLELGRHAEVVDQAQRLVGEHPLRERLWARLMLAQYRCGRRAEALNAYHRARRVLVEELGLEPGPELRELQRLILAGQPELLAPAHQRDGRPPHVRGQPFPDGVAYCRPGVPARAGVTLPEPPAHLPPWKTPARARVTPLSIVDRQRLGKTLRMRGRLLGRGRPPRPASASLKPHRSPCRRKRSAAPSRRSAGW